MKLILEAKLEIGPIKMNGLTAFLTIFLVALGVYIWAPELVALFYSETSQVTIK